MQLCELKIKNFRCIGDDELTIRIDDIVVLIGPNNVGKSTVLRAYEAFVSSGSPLPLEYFHNQSVDKPIEITGTFNNINKNDIDKIGQKWVYNHYEYGESITYKWVWKVPNTKGNRFSFHCDEGWIERGMGGWDSIIQSCIPIPIKINPFDDPATVESNIIDILVEAVKKSVKEDGNKINDLVKEINNLAQSVKEEIKESISQATQRVTENLNNVFKNYKVDVKPEAGKIDPDKIIASGSHVKITDPEGNELPLQNQGTGLQRAFLWSAIESLAQCGKYKVGKKKIPESSPRVLLIEEPEAFLHPPAIREAREALYKISEINNWQVMITTHSPVFIDVSKPHTTIIRVEKESDGSTKTFSTDKAEFNADERKRLQMIRACHPTINEFFFSNKIFLVEGETEQAVLNKLKELTHESDAHVVNCLGKANIPMFQKILNHFGVQYIVMHDVDSPRVLKNGKWIKNPMWTINEKIYRESINSQKENIVIANIPDFERQFFGSLVKGDKPYKALEKIMNEQFKQTSTYNELINMFNLDYLIHHPRKIKSETDYSKLIHLYIDFSKETKPEKWDYNF